MAGVIMLSPKNSEAPKIPSAASTTFARRPPGRARRRIKAISAMIPPSPSLSARITSRTYVTVTMIVTDQKISEMIPKMLSCGHLDRVRIARTEDRLDGVQRARADVPEDNSESTDRESPLGGSASVHAHSIRQPVRSARTSSSRASEAAIQGSAHGSAEASAASRSSSVSP